MVQMRIGVAVLMETKIVNDQYPKAAAGYTIMCSKAASCTKGRVALMWKENNPKFEVELVLFNNCPNVLTFQLVMGDEQFYVVGVYTPPNCTRGVEDLRRAGKACPAGCKLVIMGDLNVNAGFPRDKWEEVIVDLLNETNLINTLRGFRLRTPCRTATRARWTWIQKRGTTQYYTQPDYILARTTESFF